MKRLLILSILFLIPLEAYSDERQREIELFPIFKAYLIANHHKVSYLKAL